MSGISFQKDHFKNDNFCRRAHGLNKTLVVGGEVMDFCYLNHGMSQRCLWVGVYLLRSPGKLKLRSPCSDWALGMSKAAQDLLIDGHLGGDRR